MSWQSLPAAHLGSILPVFLESRTLKFFGAAIYPGKRLHVAASLAARVAT